MAGEKKLNMQVLATQDKLSDDDLKNIQAEVLAEEGIKPPEEEVVIPPAKEPETEEEKKTAEDAKKVEDEAKKKEEEDTAAKEADAQAKEAERLLTAKPEDLSDEDKTKREELVKAQETAKQEQEVQDKRVREDAEKEIKTYATEHKISEDEARTDLESRGKILEKYKGDPKQLALANLHLQRLYAKTQADLKAEQEATPLKSAKTASIEDYIKLIDDGKVQIKGKTITREEAISIYREQFPDISDGVEDVAIIKLVAKELKDGYIKSQEKEIAELSTQAVERRTTLLNSLPEADKKFIPEIQPLLEKYPPAAIMSENFKLDDIVLWAKGKAYDKDIREVGEKEYKRGLQQAKIIGQKETPLGTGSQKPKPKSKVTLTEDQKQRALEMYEGTTFTDEEKFAYYAEVNAIDIKDKEKK
jgi:hypothetical protein